MKKAIKAIIENGESKSKRMIKLYDLGLEIKEIASLMEVRYNFVYNVISNNCRKEGLELRTNKKNGKVKEGIINCIKENKSNVEISRELKTNYNYVFKVRKEYEQSLAE